MEQNNFDEKIDKEQTDKEKTKVEDEKQDEKDGSENVEQNAIEPNQEENKETDELSIIKKQLDESEEKYKRLLAEFDNYRKRTEK